jgi:predicted  nucleic acid-binding Zn-ribbon protein
MLQGRLSAANAQVERIRKRIKDIELEMSKETDELVTAKKDVEDIKVAIDSIPERSE